MAALIISIILFVIAVVGVGAAALSREARIPGAITALVAALLGVVVLIVACYDRVDTRNVGIITSFGRPVGVHGAGIVWHAPWKKVSELSEAIQLQAFESNSYDEASKGQGVGDNPAAISVRLANNSSAYVDENLNWRLREGAAPQLFQDYGGSSRDVFKTIKEQLVDRQAQVALSEVFAQFNPQIMLATANQQSGPTPPPGPGTPPPPPPTTAAGMAQAGADLPKMAAQVKKDLQDKVGHEIEILDVRIPRIFFDTQTQSRIDQYNQNVQETLNAQQKVKTAEQERLAAEQRAMQPPPDLRIAISNCINAASADHRDAAGCFGQIGGQPLIQLPKP
jgi:regulator of protease activity HflC (stomatin/prohibitin superfamily)